MKKENLNSGLTNPAQVALHGMVDRVTVSFLPSATRKRSFIVNDVPSDLQVNSDEHMLATVFGSLLNTVIRFTENSCIRISASRFGQVVLMNVKENHRLNGPEFYDNLRQLQQLAEKLGGNISLSNGFPDTTNITFSFVNIELAA